VPDGSVADLHFKVMASLWESVLAGLLVAVAVVAAVLVVGAFLAWRYGRRRWRALRSHGVVIGGLALWSAASGRYLRSKLPVDARYDARTPARTVRKEMWRAVDQAEAALRAADAVGAPTAEMPSLCRRLREAAVAVDRVLRIDPAGAVPPQLAAQATQVVRAAGDLQAAAVASAADATAPRLAELTRDAGHEIQLLDAGLASARSAVPGPRP
jgi:hypothetical protein